MSGILNQDDRDVIILASLIRAKIRCERTRERKCGYLIRPELNLTEMKDGVGRALQSQGIPIRLTYTEPAEITKILNVINGLEDLSRTTNEIFLVRDLNGILVQPRTHEEVMNALELIDEHESVHNTNGTRRKPNIGDE